MLITIKMIISRSNVKHFKHFEHALNHFEIIENILNMLYSCWSFKTNDQCAIKSINVEHEKCPNAD